MMKFEIKKIFSKSRNKLALLFMVIILLIVSIMTISRVEFVDENGKHSVGLQAAGQLQKAKNEWSGYLTADVLKNVLEENNRINQSKEAQSDDVDEQNKAYAEKQGISGILDVINSAFSEYRDFDYYASDRVSGDEAATIYKRRISTLKNWLDSGGETYTQAEKDFLISKYENLDTPFYYEYVDGWSALLQNISTFILILALIIGFLAAGIFSDEFHSKADAVFFSAKLGRSKAIASKVNAGFLITTVLYVIFVVLYTAIVLTVLDKGIIIKQLKIQGQPTQKYRHWRQGAVFLRGG